MARIEAGRVLCGDETAHASFSLRAAGFAMAVCVELVIIPARRWPRLVPMGGSRELGLWVFWCDFELSAQEKYFENHTKSVGVSEKSSPLPQALCALVFMHGADETACVQQLNPLC